MRKLNIREKFLLGFGNLLLKLSSVDRLAECLLNLLSQFFGTKLAFNSNLLMETQTQSLLFNAIKTKYLINYNSVKTVGANARCPCYLQCMMHRSFQETCNKLEESVHSKPFFYLWVVSEINYCCKLLIIDGTFTMNFLFSHFAYYCLICLVNKLMFCEIIPYRYTRMTLIVHYFIFQ